MPLPPTQTVNAVSNGKAARPHDQLCIVDDFGDFCRQIAKDHIGLANEGRWASLKSYLNHEIGCVVRFSARTGEKFDLVYTAGGPSREVDDLLSFPPARDTDGPDRQFYVRQCP